MSPTRRTVIEAAGAGLAFLSTSATPANAAEPTTAADLLALSNTANNALMQGDLERYRSLITLTSDFILFSPFGGRPTRGDDMTPAAWTSMGRFFRNGALTTELVRSYVSDDLAVLAVIERNTGEVGGLPAQPWDLRVTLVYRREGGAWRLAHRHADPLAGGVSLKEAAALAERPADWPRL